MVQLNADRNSFVLVVVGGMGGTKIPQSKLFHQRHITAKAIVQQGGGTGAFLFAAQVRPTSRS